MKNLIAGNLEITEIFLRLFVALALGVVLGIERTVAKKTAGMRTYGLVSLGAALFVVISEIASKTYALSSVDPLRMASQVIVGIGFIGAGLIIFKEKEAKVSGLTTAVGLWISTGIGMAAGFGMYSLAIIATILTLFVFVILWFMEKRIKKMIGDEEPAENGKVV